MLKEVLQDEEKLQEGRVTEMVYDWVNIKDYFSPGRFFAIRMTVENKNYQSLRQKENYTRPESKLKNEKQ